MYKYLSEASWSLLCTALLPVSLDETRAPAALNENRIVTPSLFCRSACVRELTMFPSPRSYFVSVGSNSSRGRPLVRCRDYSANGHMDAAFIGKKAP